MHASAVGIPGMLWPVAGPDYWVDSTNPSKRSKCIHKGACPGSSLFVTNDNATCIAARTGPFQMEDPNLSPDACFMAAVEDPNKNGVQNTLPTNPTDFRQTQRLSDRDVCDAVVGDVCCLGATTPIGSGGRGCSFGRTDAGACKCSRGPKGTARHSGTGAECAT